MEKIIEVLELMYEQVRKYSGEICGDIGDENSVETCDNEDRCPLFQYCQNDLRIKKLLRELKEA
jgi:hypothetical protein